MVEASSYRVPGGSIERTTGLIFKLAQYPLLVILDIGTGPEHKFRFGEGEYIALVAWIRYLTPSWSRFRNAVYLCPVSARPTVTRRTANPFAGLW